MSVKRTQEGQESSSLSHTRWILDPEIVGEKVENLKGCACLKTCLSSSCSCANSRRLCTVDCHSQQYRDKGVGFRCGNMHKIKTGGMARKIALLEREGFIDRQGEQRRNISYVEDSEDLMFTWDYDEFSEERPVGPLKKRRKIASFSQGDFQGPTW
jgi:hypothetical protein